MDEVKIIEFLVYLLSYLVGAIPFGVLVSHFAGKGDVRAHGSGNIGATNVTRLAGKKWGLVTLLLDGGKGAAVVLVAEHFIGVECTIICGVMAVLGHIFPVYLKFKGGKGVATAFAVFLALNLYMGLAVVATWLVVFALARISSLSALFSMLLAPTYAYLFLSEQGFLGLYAVLFMSVLVIMRHHENIRRLILGEEK